MQLMSTHTIIGRQSDYWMDRTDYTRPDFNLYTNSRSTESINQQSTGSMLNNNNPNTINSNHNNNNNPTVNQSSIIDAADVWCSDKIDTTIGYPLFSPDSTKSSNSPSGLNSSDLTEESFIFETSVGDTSLPFKYSQDYENFEFVDEINQLSKLKEFNGDIDYQNNLKIEDDDDLTESSKFESAKAVLYHDTMITGFAPPTMFQDEDTYLVTVNNFDDLIIKPEDKQNKIDANVSNVNSYQMVCEQNISDYILTPAPSPKSPINTNRNCNDDNIDDCGNSSDCSVNEMVKASSPAEDRLHLEHNYNLNNPYNNRIDETSSCKSILVTDRSPTRQQEKRTRNRNKSLKLNIPIMRTLRQDSVKIDVNTPDITNGILEMENNVKLRQYAAAKDDVNTPDLTNDILEMEGEKFDLISYIISSQDKNLTESTIDLDELKPIITTVPRPPTPLDVEGIINEQCPIPTKRRRNNSYDNPGSVQSMTSTIQSDDSSTHPPVKRRGRPPKTECTLPSPSMFKHLSESDWKYMEMRNKNNEASRRSRINRKDREHQIETEAKELENEHRILAAEEQALLKQVAKWRQAVMKLAQI